ncbi:tRNA guanosine(34) transglycosylase Tgt [Candidatus Woesearchaeota archaeon]|jgi:queuine tRNA-ribosyltransferase|nr:tRNA guanosine(34) transglycosylase Tgt [Candidatus Woesearchaeota archaeon]MBT4111281.1 tRNA guanosine(34) transglycosylase Tgt [Candidatus Woesearchaeota archaeon]MBT4335808.1 tRNA guanosine(34) transglycosylase Tgt [Candidatus Woesearchaeota archaeon]MBT4469214.1 tRNA guanosine(34) transglycosylase Tgt [Candidatus Woesearchaeota archaeon]MBT6744379.1 tRNA guanosine(34) transglycosylase Tgt [Candidatus Woesearchaeota archaeon]
MFSFTINKKLGQARTGIIKTAHGDIRTPAFIPVATKATVKSLTPKQLNEIGFDAILSNTYHLYLQPGADVVEKLGGLQKVSAWHKPMFTDSGGFQVMSLNESLCKVDDEGVDFRSCIDDSKHRFTPEKSMQIQRKLGADLIFSFDQCLDINADYETTKESLARTHAWEERSLVEFKKLNIDNKQALYGIVQGGRFKDLREESAKFIASLDFDALSIGSIFGDPKEESFALVKHAMKFLPEEKTKHLLGIGTVEDIFNYVSLGLDTFDCVLATRLARQGSIFLRPESGGNEENKFRYRITNVKFKESLEPLDNNCECYVCKNFSQGYINHLFKAKEILSNTLATYHNLYFFKKMMDEIRESIEDGGFVELKKKWLERN